MTEILLSIRYICESDFAPKSHGVYVSYADICYYIYTGYI